MKTFLLFLLLTLTASASPLSDGVKGFFAKERKLAGEKYTVAGLTNNQAPANILDGMNRGVFPKFASGWLRELDALKASADQTTGDKTLLMYIVFTEKALNEAVADKAKKDEAMRKLRELLARASR